MLTFGGSLSHSQDDARAIERIKDADRAVRLAKEQLSITAFAVAKDELRSAVLAAHDLGVSWQSIGDGLGIRRGAAYQRFRRRPDERSGSDRTSTLESLFPSGDAYRQWIEQLHPLDGAPPQ
jgi:hypothetical protein